MLLISIHLACMLKKNMSISNYLCHAYYEPGNAIDSGLTPGSEDSLEKEWLPTPVFLPGEFHGQRSLAGYSPWGRKESGMTERLTTGQAWHFSIYVI